jgi:hypothetical protein
LVRPRGSVDGSIRRVRQLRRIARRARIALHERKRRKLLGSLEQLTDVRRPVGDLPPATEPHAVDDGPVDQRFVGVVVWARVVVGRAVAELEIQASEPRLIGQQRHEQLAVDLADLRLTDGLADRGKGSR